MGEGDSEAPQSDSTAKLIEAQDHNEKVTWRNFAEYSALLTTHGIGMNVIHNVGAAQVREVVMGDIDPHPTPAELEKMKALVAEAMQQGAVGLSSTHLPSVRRIAGQLRLDAKDFDLRTKLLDCRGNSAQQPAA